MSNIKYVLYGVLMPIALDNVKHRRKILRKFYYITNKDTIKSQQKKYTQSNKKKSTLYD
jgi:hypothetical protein